MGQGCVNTSKPSARAIAASIIPAASAMRTASAVGGDTACEVPKGRRADRARLDVKLLPKRQALHGSHDLLWCELPAAPDDSRRAHRFRDRLNAAQSAPGRSCNVPPSLLQAI